MTCLRPIEYPDRRSSLLSPLAPRQGARHIQRRVPRGVANGGKRASYSMSYIQATRYEKACSGALWIEGPTPIEWLSAWID